MTVSFFDTFRSVMPGGVSSGARAFGPVGVEPLVAERGEGSFLYTTEGKKLFDLCGSWGPLIHGHAHPKVIEAVKKQLSLGTTYGLSSLPERDLAKEVIARVPWVERVRFVSSGTEATMSALRLARGVTHRDLVVKFAGNYHGHANVEPTRTLPYNDVEALESIDNSVAAVIVEPVAGNMGVVPATKEFLIALREKTKEVGALLIFDEVITGFRIPTPFFGIAPDLSCFGKILGGGFPAAAFGGPAEYLEQLAPIGPVFHAGTLSGNPVAMRAGLASLQMLDQPAYTELEKKTQRIVQPVREAIVAKGIPACVQSAGSMFTLFFGVEQVKNFADAKRCDTELFAKYYRHMLDSAIFLPPSQFEACFLATVHKESELDEVAAAILAFLEKV